ncbi:MAG: Spy/CpxP family protein refolding chaperone [Betaproteobacteria bacterium]
MKLALKSLIVTAALATLGLAAMAQNGPKEEPFGMMEIRPMHHMNPEKIASMVERHLSHLKAKLHITAVQESAWTTFATAMKPPATMGMPHPESAEMEKLSTPERIDKMRAFRAQHHEAMLAEINAREEAVKTFYAALSPEQRKTFDAEHARMERHSAH